MRPTRILGTFREGRLEFDVGVDWPEGTRVEVHPLAETPAVGMDESEWPTTIEGLAELRSRMLQREPLEMTDAEFADWEANRQSERQRQIEFTRQSWSQAERPQ